MGGERRGEGRGGKGEVMQRGRGGEERQVVVKICHHIIQGTFSILPVLEGGHGIDYEHIHLKRVQ